MPTRRLERLGVDVGAIGLGCLPLSAAYEPGTKDEAHGVAVVRRALDVGVTLFDTSDAYGPRTNEELLGAALAGRRDDVVLATKAGCVPQVGSYVPVPDGRPSVLQRCLDDSLRRLRTDHVDLWQLHRADPAVPIEESVGAMGDAVAAGKALGVGVCEVGVDQLAAAHAAHPLTSVQSELSLWTRGALDEVLPWCEANGVAFLPFAPLGRGFLTGAIDAATDFADDDVRAVNPRFTASARAANQRIVDGVRAVAAAVDATPAQVALAWLLAQGDAVVPIPGSDRIEYLEENVAAADVVLDAAALAALDELPAAVGERY
jgi:aryl-alcohol dehydrogenase-like predicted oxidoreductase